MWHASSSLVAQLATGIAIAIIVVCCDFVLLVAFYVTLYVGLRLDLAKMPKIVYLVIICPLGMNAAA